MTFAIKKSVEYRLISDFYGDKVAKRSQVPLMNHIDEGLVIMTEIRADPLAMRAFCLHPIVQSDEDLRRNIKWLLDVMSYTDDSGHIMTYVMEYRSVANRHLLWSDDTIRLSPMKQVNDMLIADKVQNKKDFDIHHLGKHPHSNNLEMYFYNWLKSLSVTDGYYLHLRDLIT